MKADLINRMGDDLTVVNAARVSFNKETDWGWWDDDGYEHGGLDPKDQKLIKYLATHGHWTPFSHVQITMREKVPLFVARQRFKHMVGFTYNEESRRYVSEAPEFYTPDVWRRASVDKKQGSSSETVSLMQMMTNVESYPIEIGNAYQLLVEAAQQTYEAMIFAGVAPEQARMVLPQSMYTSYYVTGSLAAWSRAYKLRIASDAQKEIQELAQQWDKIISNIPELKHSWSALNVA